MNKMTNKRQKTRTELKKIMRNTKGIDNIIKKINQQRKKKETL